MSPSSWPRCSGARQVIDGAYPVDRDTAGRHPARRPRPPPGPYVLAPTSIPRSSRSSSGKADGSSPRGDPRHPGRPCGPHQKPDLQDRWIRAPDLRGTGHFIMPFMRVPGGMRVQRAPIGRTLRSITRGWSASAALVAGFCTFSSGGLLASLGSVVLESSLVCAERRARRTPGLPVLRPVHSDRSCALARGDPSIVGVALWWTAAGAFLPIAAVFDSVATLILAAVCCGVGQGVGLHSESVL